MAIVSSWYLKKRDKAPGSARKLLSLAAILLLLAVVLLIGTGVRFDLRFVESQHYIEDTSLRAQLSKISLTIEGGEEVQVLEKHLIASATTLVVPRGVRVFAKEMTHRCGKAEFDKLSFSHVTSTRVDTAKKTHSHTEQVYTTPREQLFLYHLSDASLSNAPSDAAKRYKSEITYRLLNAWVERAGTNIVALPLRSLPQPPSDQVEIKVTAKSVHPSLITAEICQASEDGTLEGVETKKLATSVTDGGVLLPEMNLNQDAILFVYFPGVFATADQ